MAIVDYNNPASYKNCSKKSYEIYVCKPPKDTVVINKLEQADAVKLLNGKTYFTVEELERMQKNGDGRFNLISQVLSAGKAYLVSDKTPFVLCGTVGEIWTVSADKLAKTYTFLQNGQPLQINQQSLNQRMKNGNLDWTLIRTSQQATSGQNMACFIPRAQKGQIQTSWGAALELNGVGVDHGKGDFVVCAKLPNGQPNLADRWVVNGNIFATTYNNQGWQDCLNTNGMKNITIDSLPRLIPVSSTSDSARVKPLFDKLCFLLEQLKRTAVLEMPFNYRRVQDDVIQVKPAVIENYRNDTQAAHEGNRDLSVRERQQKFSHFITTITAKDDKLQFKSFNTFNGDHAKELVYSFELPANEQGLNMFQQNLQFYGGLMGYIPSGVQNSFSFIERPSKFEFDGMHAYTVSSSGINRKLRLQDTGNREYERLGEESQRLYRAINGADNYFGKVISNKPLVVYRGVPCNGALRRMGASSIDCIAGCTETNTAYTSTSCNLHSAMMFAKDLNRDPNGGIIFAINIPSGVSADFIHNVAGWKEQFEVLLDRKYDIQARELLMTIKGGNSFNYYIVGADLVEHAPFSHIPATISVSAHRNIEGIEFYDRNGKINFDYEMVKGEMQEAFDMLKKKGITGLQYQTKLGVDPLHRDFIVAHAGENDDNTVTDLAFTYNSSTGLIDVLKFISKARVTYTDKFGNERVGTARNYWSDVNRNNGSIDQNFSWESYNANNEGFTGVNANNFSFQPKSSIIIKSPNYRSKNYGKFWEAMDLKEHLGECIAFTILDYLKYNKDVTLLPMQDVARYFDVVFKTTILDEGYMLKDSIPVNRVGNPENENDGYVPMKYVIDGDNDDTLTIMLRLSRDSNGKLQLTYRGASNNNRVREEDTLRWSIFNQEIMERECNRILYIFASKLNLNHTRKADQLLNFVARNCSFELTRAYEKSGTSIQDRNIHGRGNHKLYRLWYSNKKDNIKVTLDVEKSIMNFYLHDTNNRTVSFNLDSRKSILVLYREFQQKLTEMR